MGPEDGNGVTVPAAASGQDGWADAGAVERLRRFGGDRLVRKMTALFLEIAPARLEQARKGLLTGDSAALGHQVHSLKSSAGQLGGMAMYRLCREIGVLAAAQALGAVPPLLEELCQEFIRFRGWLYMQQPHGGPMKTIAVVEDNADNRMLLQALLAEQYDVTEYEDGAGALAGLRRSLPDLVILDISLPGMDGVEVLSHIRADPRLQHLPVVCLTAHAMVGDRERYLAAGFDEYVSKPIVDEQVLFDVIGRFLPDPA